MKFKVGDIVKCINVGSLPGNASTDNPPLRLNTEYIVNKIITCKCSRVKLDIGIIATSEYCKCQCGRLIPQYGSRLCDSIRFIKRQPIQEQIDEAVQEEDYELAHLLSKLAN